MLTGEYEQFCRTLTVAAVCHYLKGSLHCVKNTVQEEVVDNTNLINITIAQLRGSLFRHRCSAKEILVQSNFY